MSNNKCTLSDKELIEKCNEWVHSLAKSGGKTWTLQVPVNFNLDPDMLFIELGKRFEQLKAENSKMRKALEGVYHVTEGNVMPSYQVFDDLHSLATEALKTNTHE